MADYSLSQLASRDIDHIYEYIYRQFGEEQADAYVEQIRQSARIAANFPRTGRLYTTRSGLVLRQYSCGRHALFYVPQDNGILVVRVLHLMMDFDRHL